MKVSKEQLSEEVNEILIPYLSELSLPIKEILMMIQLYAIERLNDYEWEDSDRAMDVIREEVDKYFAPPSFEERFGPICLN
jgi:hypothetical protein